MWVLFYLFLFLYVNLFDILLNVDGDAANSFLHCLIMCEGMNSFLG